MHVAKREWAFHLESSHLVPSLPWLEKQREAKKKLDAASPTT